MTDAIDILKDHNKKHSKNLQQTGISDGYMLEPQCNKLVTACCLNSDVSQAIELTNVLFDCGFVKPGTYVVLEKLVGGYLRKYDLRYCQYS